MALRNPAMILDYHMSQPGKYGQNKLYGSAVNLWAEWEREDPEAATAWSDKFSDGQLSGQGMVYILVKRKEKGQLK